MSLLEVRGLSVRFGGLLAVDDLSLVVRRGEIVALIGPNGAGKTTFLGAVGGQLAPDGGRVGFLGRDVTGWPPERRALAGMARTFQRLELFGRMTVLENLLVAAEARFAEADFVADLFGRHRRGDADRAAREVAARLGLEDVADRRADQLPTGFGRLVEIGRALCTRPSLLLLDEPTGGLDEAETERVRGVLADLPRDGGPALLLVEHDVDLVMDLSHRIAVMDFGRLIAEGTPSEVRRHPEVQRAYLGREVTSATGAGGRRGA